jgi:ubiquinone/menaquinone biosynthesis C-methylase UbiE
MTSSSLGDYYETRATEYDQIYRKPERQEDLAALQAELRALFAGRSVLEIATGTGYWTQHIAAVAAKVVATDINPAPLAIAKTRDYGQTPVDCRLADAFALEDIEGEFDSLFAGFWWSHVAIRDIPRFLGQVRRRLASGNLVVMIDNRYVEGSNHPIARVDEEGNTYQWRSLADGTQWEVLKNFPTAADLRAAVRPYAKRLWVNELTYYWLLGYTSG